MIADKAVGNGFTVTLNAGDDVPAKHVLAPETVTDPETAPLLKLTSMEFVPLPDAIVAPDGKVQLYVVALVRAATEYATEFCPAQTVAVPVITPAAPIVCCTVRLVPLFDPMIDGLEEITLILYPVPTAVPPGIVHEIVPEVEVELRVPIEVPGKTPVELESCAVYMLPAFAGPSPVKLTLITLPGQRIAEPKGCVVIAVNTLLPAAIVKLTFEISKNIFPAPSTFTLAVDVNVPGTVMFADPVFGTLEARVVG